MLVISRRDFFKKSGASAVAMSVLASQVGKLKANPLGLPIGSQTYPHRSRIQCNDFAGLLKDMKGIGIQVIELCNPTYNEFKSLADGKMTKKILDDAGMKAVSAHFGMPSLRNDQANQIKWAQDVGLEMMSTADLGGRVSNGRTTEEEIKRAASEYNKIAEVAMRNGMQQILHNEGFANSYTEDGRLTYPLLLQYLDPNLVKMQFQMSSMNVVGDPIMYFTNHPGRFISAHLQGVNTTAGMRGMPAMALPVKSDGADAGRGAGARGGGRAGGGAPVDPCAARGAAPAAAPAAGARAGLPAGGGGGQALALGEDTVDWTKVFAAAKIGGLKYAFIEQGWEQTVKSAAFLKTLTVS